MRMPMVRKCHPLLCLSVALMEKGLRICPDRSGGQARIQPRLRPILAENCFACHGPDSAARRPNSASTSATSRRARRHRPRRAGRERLVERDLPDDPTRSCRRPRPQEADRRTEGNAPPLGRRRGRVPAALVFIRRCGHAAQVERPTGCNNPSTPSSWPSSKPRPAPAAGGRPPHAGPPPQPRPDRPAARSAVVEEPSSTTRTPTPTKSSSTPAGHRRSGASTGAALARCRPLRRHARHPHRQLPRDLALSRLGHQGLQPQPALRPVHDRAARRRPAAGAHARAAIASGFNRCNITTNEGGVIEEEYLVVYARDRTETSARSSRLTAGCAVATTTSTTRSPRRTSIRCSRFSTTRRRRPWMATSRIPRPSSSSPPPPTAAAGTHSRPKSLLSAPSSMPVSGKPSRNSRNGWQA